MVTVILMFLAPALLTAQGPADHAVRTEIDVAEVYYRLALAERGNLKAFDEARWHLDRASAALSRAESDLTPEHRRELSQTIEGLATDIKEQRDMAHDTLYGVFPLLRLLKKSLFSDPGAGGTFELVDDPEVVAVTKAAERMANALVDTKVTQPQLRVLITSDPPRPDLENEVLYVFNTYPNFSVITRRALSDALGRSHIDRLDGGELDSAALAKVAEASGVPELLWTRIVKGPSAAGDFLYLIEARLFVTDQDESRLLMRSYGLCRDRRSQAGAVAFAHLALLALAVVFAAVAFQRQSASNPIPVGRFIGFAATGFLLGRVYPWMVLPLIGSFSPEPESLAILSFWWPCAVGVVLFGGPVVILRIAKQRFGLGSLESGLESALACSLVFGVTAYLSAPVFMLVGTRGVIALAAFAVAGCLAVVLLLKGISRSGSFNLVALALVLMFLVGAVGTHLELGSLITLITVAIAIAPLSLNGPSFSGAWIKLGKLWSNLTHQSPIAPQDVDDLEQPKRADEPAHGLTSLLDVIARASNPEYVELDWYSRVRDLANSSLDPGTCTWLALVGERGSGKTATANALIDWVDQNSEGLIRFDIECHKPIGEEVPFDSVRDALAKHFRVDFLTEDPDPKMAGVDEWLDGFFDSMVPFAGIIFPPKDEQSMQAASRAEVHSSVGGMLRHMAGQGVLVLFVDDAQWIDGASRELISYLVRRGLPTGDKLKVLGVVTSRTREAVENLGIAAAATVEIRETRTEDKVLILESALGFSQELAREVVNEVEDCGIEGDNLFWLFHVAAHLARVGEIEASDGGFRRSSRLAPHQVLSVPGDFQGAIMETLSRWPEYRHVLECAACYGREFDAEILARSLDTTPLEMLRVLHSIERETGLIFDVKDADNIFAFRSSFLLETIRQNLGITGSEDSADEIPQIVREYHARIARGLEAKLRSNPALIYEVASHFAMAGAKHATKAKRHCLAAARAAAGVFEHETARRYVRLAEQAAGLSGGGETARTELLMEILRIEAMVAHISQENVLQTAQHMYDFVTSHEEVPVDLLILAVRTCYEAGGPDAHQQWFERSVDQARRGLGMTDDPVAKAEFEQFIGIGLPPAQSEQRKRHLEAAWSYLDELQSEDLRTLALRGRVANSLAIEVAKSGSLEDRARAEELFNLSLSIKERPEMRDLKGQAITHGCLGRHYYFHQPPDIGAARRHFEADLEISLKIGDRLGRSTMFSFLGACNAAEGQMNAAIASYREAEAAAPDDMNRMFALCGLIKALVFDQRIDEAHEAGRRLGTCVASLVDAGSKFRPETLLEVVSIGEVANAEWARSVKKLSVGGTNS